MFAFDGMHTSMQSSGILSNLVSPSGSPSRKMFTSPGFGMSRFPSIPLPPYIYPRDRKIFPPRAALPEHGEFSEDEFKQDFKQDMPGILVKGDIPELRKKKEDSLAGCLGECYGPISRATNFVTGTYSLGVASSIFCKDDFIIQTRFGINYFFVSDAAFKSIPAEHSFYKVSEVVSKAICFGDKSKQKEIFDFLVSENDKRKAKDIKIKAKKEKKEKEIERELMETKIKEMEQKLLESEQQKSIKRVKKVKPLAKTADIDDELFGVEYMAREEMLEQQQREMSSSAMMDQMINFGQDAEFQQQLVEHSMQHQSMEYDYGQFSTLEQPLPPPPKSSAWRPMVRKLPGGTDGKYFSTSAPGKVWVGAFGCLYLSSSVVPLTDRALTWAISNVSLPDYTYPDDKPKRFQEYVARKMEHIMYVFGVAGAGYFCGECLITYAVKVYAFMSLLRAVDLQPRQGNDPNECSVKRMDHSRGGSARRGRKAVKERKGTLDKPIDGKHAKSAIEEAHAMLTELRLLVNFKDTSVDIPDQESVLKGVMNMFDELSRPEKEAIVANNSSLGWWDKVPSSCERQWMVIRQIAMTLALYECLVRKAPSFALTTGPLGFNGSNLIIDQLGPAFTGVRDPASEAYCKQKSEEALYNAFFN